MTTLTLLYLLKKYVNPRRATRLTLLLLLMVTLSGCLGFESNDPTIAENLPIVDPVAFAYSRDYRQVSGELFEYDRKSGFYGIVFSHDLGAPHGGFFVLGNTEELYPFIPGDKITLTGEVTDKQLNVWQSGVFYEIHTADYTKGFEPQ